MAGAELGTLRKGWCRRAAIVFSLFLKVSPSAPGPEAKFRKLRKSWCHRHFPAFQVSIPATPAGGDTLKTLRMVGPLPFLTFSKFRPRRRPLGSATGDTASQGQQRYEKSQFAATPPAPKRNVENWKMGRSPPGATLSKFGFLPLGGGGDPTPTAKFRTPPGRGGVLYGSTAGTPMGRSQ